MKIEDMSKDDFIKYRMTKGTPKEEITTEWEKLEKQFKDSGYSEKDAVERTKRKLVNFYMIQDRFPTVNVEGIIIGFQESDYGARRQYQKALEEYKKSPEQAIVSGFVTPDGKPLHQTGFSQGQIIDLKNVTERSYIGMYKAEGDDKFIIGEVKGRGVHAPPELFARVSFKAGVGKKNSKEYHVYTIVKTTAFATHEKLNDSQVMSLLKDNFGEKLVELGSLKDWCSQHEKDFSWCIIKGNVYQLNDDPLRKRIDMLTGEEVTKGNFLGLASTDVENPITIGCSGSSDIKFNFDDMAMDIVALGRPRVRQDTGELSMQLYGVYCPMKHQIKEKKVYIKPVEKIEEKKEAGAW